MANKHIQLSSTATKLIRLLSLYGAPVFMLLIMLLMILDKSNPPIWVYIFVLSAFTYLYVAIIIPKFGKIHEVFSYDNHLLLVRDKIQKTIPKKDIIAVTHGMSALYTIRLNDGEKYYFISTVANHNIEKKDVIIQSEIKQ